MLNETFLGVNIFTKKLVKVLKWYFVTKIVLTYCEKKLFYKVFKHALSNFKPTIF